MLKKRLIATTIALALVVPTTVFAATSTSTTAIKIRGLFGIDSSKLTTAQQADVKDYAQKMADLQKSLLDKMVSNGSMTQAQADAQKAQIDSDLANGEVFVGGGHAQKGQAGVMHGGMNTSKLTDEQKNTLLTLKKEQLTLENNLAKILVEQKLITQAQADAIKTNVDAAVAALITSDSARKKERDCIDGLAMLRGVTLTDTQKTALLGWAASSAAVEKKIVALYKDAGIITQAQADTINTQIDKRATDPLSFTKIGKGMIGNGMIGKSKMGGGMMNGGKMGGGHKRQDRSPGNDSDSSQPNSGINNK